MYKWHELHVGVVFSLSILFTVRVKHSASWKLFFSPKQTAEKSSFYQTRRQHTKNIFSSEKRFHIFLLLHFQNKSKIARKSTQVNIVHLPTRLSSETDTYLFDEVWLTCDDRLRQD